MSSGELADAIRDRQNSIDCHLAAVWHAPAPSAGLMAGFTAGKVFQQPMPWRQLPTACRSYRRAGPVPWLTLGTTPVLLNLVFVSGGFRLSPPPMANRRRERLPLCCSGESLSTLSGGAGQLMLPPELPRGCSIPPSTCCLPGPQAHRNARGLGPGGPQINAAQPRPFLDAPAGTGPILRCVAGAPSPSVSMRRLTHRK